MNSNISHTEIAFLIDHFVKSGGSDLYITVGKCASVRVSDGIIELSKEVLTGEQVKVLISSLVGHTVMEEFESTLEYNTAINWKDEARLRINLYKQRQHPALVVRRINTQIPTIRELDLPSVYSSLVMEKRGLVLVVGPTGSGKSTSLAAMVGHRNTHGSGHIVTIEDPVEFLHEHRQCIVSQRDVGIDTYSFGIALKNALRQSPDVIMIGEIRDRETMEHAIVFSETGHLVLATLHANNSNQAIERIVNFFPEEKHKQVLLNLSLNLRGVLSQRLLHSQRSGRVLAVEIMLNQGLIRNLIFEGKIREIKECIEKAKDIGMQSFDQALFDLKAQGTITEELALMEADNPANLRLMFKQEEMRQKMQRLGSE